MYSEKTSGQFLQAPSVPSVQKQSLDLGEIHQAAGKLWPPTGKDPSLSPLGRFD